MSIDVLKLRKTSEIFKKEVGNKCQVSMYFKIREEDPLEIANEMGRITALVRSDLSKILENLV